MIKAAFILIPIALALMIGAYAVALKSSEKQVTLTVEDKESVTVSDGDNGVRNEYRVYTSKGVYVVADSVIYFNFRAADRYAALKEGRTYTCTQAGWRIGIFSAFPNLIECEAA